MLTGTLTAGQTLRKIDFTETLILTFPALLWRGLSAYLLVGPSGETTKTYGDVNRMPITLIDPSAKLISLPHAFLLPTFLNTTNKKKEAVNE